MCGYEVLANSGELVRRSESARRRESGERRAVNQARVAGGAQEVRRGTGGKNHAGFSPDALNLPDRYSSAAQVAVRGRMVEWQCAASAAVGIRWLQHVHSAAETTACAYVFAR